MRDLVLVLGMLFYLPMALRLPAAGTLCWVWFSIMNPHRQVYGFTYGQPLNGIIAVATLIGWFVSREPKRLPRDATLWLLLALTAWMTLDTPFGAVPEYSWEFWDRTIRLVVMILMVYLTINTKARIHGMVWVLLISLGFYGLKGGAFTILKGGHYIVYGPPDSVYTDNNQLALAVVTELPLLYYVAQYSRAAWLRVPAFIAMGLQVIMVFGSYSRGGVLALGVMGSILWLRSHRKVLYLGIAAVGIVAALSLMPASFFDRLHTINSYNSDESFQGRVNAWHAALLYSLQHFPFGAGFNGVQVPWVFNSVLPDEAPHAAHSIYFQILGDHGWAGMALYLPILLLGLRNAGVVRKQTHGNPDLLWAYDLADMMRISLIAFYFGGAALSMAYSDVYLVVIAMLANLRLLTQPATVAEQARSYAREQRQRPVPALQPEAAPGRALLRHEP